MLTVILAASLTALLLSPAYRLSLLSSDSFLVTGSPGFSGLARLLNLGGLRVLGESRRGRADQAASPGYRSARQGWVVGLVVGLVWEGFSGLVRQLKP